MEKRIIAIAGPSCGGKTTLKQSIEDRWGEATSSVVTSTTRRPRAGEVSGIDYHFRSRKQFVSMISNGLCVEWVSFDNEYYGTESMAVDAALSCAAVAVVVMTPDGVRELQCWADARGVRLTKVFVTAPVATLRERLHARIPMAGKEETDRRIETLGEQCKRWRTSIDYDVIANNPNHRLLAAELVGSL